ncbi:hypothetical protein GCM10022251_36930 [Phytohabitans flavus]|uniref:Uncharacterized protein n=1 Tax=Phytohabitans flavus TaxID=1076124 RepID=A0A6F8XVY6_9ACTN|nr:hypothetical protein [Phytohabitans flavus]BCB78004.1 hypothetical protein Pflav_044140 [Phytohabitans flavus]
MDPTRQPAAPRGGPSDAAVVAYLRAGAPGLPIAQFDGRAVTSQARAALRRRRRNFVKAVAGATAAYVALALAGPLPVPGLDIVTAPAGTAIRALEDLAPGEGPGPYRRKADVDRLETEVLPVVQELQVAYYRLTPVPCRQLEYPRGSYGDGPPECGASLGFDAEARADFDEVTAAVERSGVAIIQIFRQAEGGIDIALKDDSWQHHWSYVYLPDASSPPPTIWPGEEWTHIRDDWWLYRVYAD